mgnify:CR=1 FL=1
MSDLTEREQGLAQGFSEGVILSVDTLLAESGDTVVAESVLKQHAGSKESVHRRVARMRHLLLNPERIIQLMEH